MNLIFKKITPLTISTLLILGLILTILYPDKNLFTLSSLERDQMLKRDGYLRIGVIGQIYGRKLGKYYFNRYMIYSQKIFQKISVPLDPIKYFNSGEQNIMPYFLLPFFILGLLYLVEHHLAGLYGYLSVSVVFTCLVVADKTVYLYLPLMVLATIIGFLTPYKYLKKFKR